MVWEPQIGPVYTATLTSALPNWCIVHYCLESALSPGQVGCSMTSRLEFTITTILHKSDANLFLLSNTKSRFEKI